MRFGHPRILLFLVFGLWLGSGVAQAAGPTVTAIAPAQGTVGSSVPVTITGTRFQSGATLSVGAGITVSNVVVSSATSLTATLAIATSATLGSRTVTVTNTNGQNGTLASGFSVVAAPPTVTAINPTQGTVGASVPVTLTGTNFQSGATLSIGTGVTVSSVAVPSATQLTATLAIAAGATLGARNVTVTNPGGLSGTLTSGFSVVAAAAPIISGVASGSITASGATITWTTDQTADSQVEYGLTTAYGSSTTLNTSLVTGHSVGLSGLAPSTLYHYRVKSRNAGGALATSGDFTLTTAGGNPTVTAITPTQGMVGSTVPVTITGTNFQSGATLSVGAGITVGSVVVSPPSSLTASLTISSSATVGTRDVTVTNPDSTNGTLPGGFSVTAAGPRDISYVYDELGRLIAVVDPGSDTAIYQYDAVGNLLSIMRRNSSVVSIIDFWPRTGPVGTVATISGTSFAGLPAQNTVTFNGVTAVVTSASATQLAVIVPTGATTGPISVTTAAGSASSAAPFTVGGGAGGSAPTITSFTPTIATTGTAVSITGTNYDTTISNDKVVFNVLQATVASATSTTISTSVPTGATSGRISVTTPLGKATSASDFFVPPSPYLASDVVATGRMTIGSTATVNVNTANKIGLMLFDGTAGQRVSLNLTGVTITSAVVTVYNTFGVTLGSVTAGTNGGFIDAFTLPTTGTYTILIAPSSTNTGSITLTLNDLPPDVTGSITPGGPSVTVTITGAGQNAILSFSGTAGQRVSLSLSGSTIPCCTGIYIRNPFGTTLANIGMGIGSSYIDTTTLPTTGTYSILIDPSSTNTGSITLTLNDVPPDVTGTITPGGPSVTVTITGAGQNAILSFSGTAGQRVSLSLSGSTIPCCTGIYIRNPDGTTLANIGMGIGSSYIDTTTLPTTGTYSILIDPSSTNTGSITLTLNDLPPDVTGTVTIGGSAVTVTITTPGQNGYLTFSGASGQQVTVHVTNNTVGYTYVTLLNPDNTTLTAAATSASSFDLSTQTLPTTGTYTIKIDPNATNIGSMNVSVTSP